MNLKDLAWVCVGGAVGSGLRFLVSSWTLARYGTSFPYGTLAVNVVGSLILACLFQLSRSTQWLSPTLQAALGAGVLGGLTTYSTFNLEIVRYVQEGQVRMAVVYGSTTLCGCLAAGPLGIVLGRFISGR
jgi:fluoride exporter